ncbi:bifunctional histidinol-phosphatase/imidazoleglycerol-phosphate dehydratase HisB [Legionella clemsonensis]|uniref:Histidine biosynthesis bifunctional protein HisB n=1 Tax=Legionella clemsonensis TaxID=1867846 RepID=A0A222P2P8_9GAMM|nr:bifunctional histidinol-phosphatase/imidazoleglycerol-phosphate dehydratase HisB [Legionella clemsonensis]ASQ46128.1 Histidine biosynthesis bifunctional protein HisB [Legionella clemsonensis]
MQKVLLIDRDGTLVEEPDDFQVDRLEKIKLCKDVIPNLLMLSKAGFKLIMISNQDGLGTDRFPQDTFQRCHDFILNLFISQGIHFSEIFICPHTEASNCSCRKPKAGLLLDFLRNTSVDRDNSWVIGDRETDRQLAENIGIAFLPVASNHGWDKITPAILLRERSAYVNRITRETAIEVKLTLDNSACTAIKTPLGFFNHMLEQVAKHGGFGLEINAKGDIEIDDHHLIEDTALALGEALKKALGDKWGIARYGFTLPMDESLAMVALDLGGRSYCRFEAQFTREFVGDMATEMVSHFFHSLASSLGATIHVTVTGKNHHHMIEACFKALGRALRQAYVQCDKDLPSTKGIL